MAHKFSPCISFFIVLISFLFAVHSYEELNNHNEIMAYYEEHSYMPLMHVYFNRHFSHSKQFISFLETLQEVEAQVGHFSKIILTNCEVADNQQNKACGEIKRQNENRMIVGFAPSSTFTKFGDKVMQSPPTNRVYDHISDTYTVEQLVRFIERMMPNFFKQINNIHEFEEFKKPRYSPKLMFFSQDGEIPSVIRQVGVYFFLRFDMGYVQDLTESVVNQLEVREFPALVVLKHNYEKGELQVFYYENSDFTDDNFNKIFAFLENLALEKPRNDYLFHLIRAEKESFIQTVESAAELNYALDTAKGWVFMEEGPSFEMLQTIRGKYDRYYTYVHYLKPQTPSKLFLYNPRDQTKYPYRQDSFKYNLMSAEDFQSNSSVWLRKDYVVMAVREQFGYLCTIIDKPLFIGMAQCFIIAQNASKEVMELMGINFNYGIIISSEKSGKKVQGNEIKNKEFDSVYRLLEYATRIKVKDIIDSFVEHPVKNLNQKISIQNLCAQPLKKCIFYFYSPGKDSTKKEYLEMEAINFVNEYKIYEVDLSCNIHLVQEIPQLQGKSDGLIAYHPRVNSYVYLKAKMTRSTIQKFLRINNEEKRVLPFKTFASEQVFLEPCSNAQPAESNDEL